MLQTAALSFRGATGVAKLLSAILCLGQMLVAVYSLLSKIEYWKHIADSGKDASMKAEEAEMSAKFLYGSLLATKSYVSMSS